ncbi:MAG: glycosyltransferase family 25 protein [Polynucleobacter sp.]|uniref:glycosyltransferase family 25 protein n=1 Tax=Polynucleobacter sp. TaxID=2029855 RepID=UPI002718731B|nr:glycosyltransferase family 25 protein [Polynucleobacter sp.]MDO8714477.1 glycosyltransferase family 25 protein [Polynucleobacter sp.]
MNQFLPPLQILVISLKRSLDRRKQVEQEMQKISLPWSFLDAVDGSALTAPPIEYKPSKVKRLQGYALTPNEIGCYLSHKEAWRRCVAENMPTLILEDDFVLSSDFDVILNTLLNEVTEWNFVRLQGLYEVPFKKVLEQPGFALVKNQGDAVGATAYLLKPQIASQLIKHSVDIYEPVDHFLEHYQKHGLEFLATQPYPVDITRAKSTIADRSERAPVKGLNKRIRSVARVVDRVFNREPWFPK